MTKGLAALAISNIEIASSNPTQPHKPLNTASLPPLTTILPLHTQVRWVSWPGAAVDLGAQEAVRRRLDTQYSCTPVFLSPEISDAYYHKVGDF